MLSLLSDEYIFWLSRSRSGYHGSFLCPIISLPRGFVYPVNPQPISPFPTCIFQTWVQIWNWRLDSFNISPWFKMQALAPRGSFRQLILIAQLAWDFTESNMFTFVIPNTFFGIANTLAGPVLLDLHQSLPLSLAQRLLALVSRIPLVFLFNFVNLLNFDLSNQRHPESVAEDKTNKPWRPLPSRKVTPEQIRRALHVTVPMALIINLALGAWHEGLLIEVLIWYYNDLRGGDELFRDGIIAVAYGLFNVGSLRIAACPQGSINQQGYIWTAMISGVILTTMHVQDLKDQKGDRQRGRKTVPLFFGDVTARRALSVLVPLWSFACPTFWLWRSLQVTRESTGFPVFGLMLYLLPAVLGSMVVWCVLRSQTPQDDSRAWKLWCLWHSVALYILPALSRFA